MKFCPLLLVTKSFFCKADKLWKNTSDSVVFCYLRLTNYQKTFAQQEEMKDLERDFEEIVKKNRGTIYTVCYMFSNDQDEVADMFQEVLINLWKSLPSFEGRCDVRSWIYRVSLNVCISLDHKKRRHKIVPLTMDINPYEEMESNQNSRQMDMLRRRIAKLGQFDRAIILLWLENMSYEEIAAIMGITVKNVSVRLYRIKEELKNMSND